MCFASPNATFYDRTLNYDSWLESQFFYEHGNALEGLV